MNSEETALLEMVADRHLHPGLANLRVAIEGLWQSATPHIVQDFTDHGIAHYERIAVYASNLLSARALQTAPLSPVEMFLLMGGIYLHDVGMQCDVTTPDGEEIKRRAEALGADFGSVEFVAPSANRYSLDEQKAIRKNHQYLSAAWIEYAFETGWTVLGPIVQGFPYALVPDLMDVCLYHTTLPIETCPANLAGGGVGRKRLVAALLRFADELDISSNRVDMTAVTQFAVNPENAVFWWLHNMTQVSFQAPNVFRITVLLRTADFEELHDVVQSVYLDRFQTKNRPALAILRDAGFPVFLDADGGVMPLSVAPALPALIREALSGLGGKGGGAAPADT